MYNEEHFKTFYLKNLKKIINKNQSVTYHQLDLSNINLVEEFSTKILSSYEISFVFLNAAAKYTCLFENINIKDCCNVMNVNYTSNIIVTYQLYLINNSY